VNKNIKITLPPIIEISSYGGDWDEYIKVIYNVFRNDFIVNGIMFHGKRLRIKKYPYVNGKEGTFYHFTHEGMIESKRTPSLRRCERIPWAKPVIENCDCWKLKIWPQKRKSKNRICIWLERNGEPDYIIILDVRKKYTLPWTAFTLDYNHQKQKKLNEYNEYIQKTKTARKKRTAS